MGPFAAATRPLRGRPAAVRLAFLAALALTACTGKPGADDRPADAPRPSSAPTPLLALGEQVTCVTGERPACTGRGVFQVPADPGVLAGARDLAFGLRHGCLLDDAGRASCWGDALDGQLGVEPGTVSERHLGRPARAAPVPVPGAPELASLAAGWLHTCGLSTEGGVVCWGDDALGQLGREPAGIAAAPVAGLAGVAALAAGGLHTCAIDGSGAVLCWGDGSSGHLGDGGTADSRSPVAVAGLPGRAVTLAAGGYHTCAALADGTVWCWGDNRFGQLGDGTRERRSSPTPVSGLPGPARALAAGSSFSCALLEGGAVHCWGSDEFGELGAGEGAAPGDRRADQGPAAPRAVAGLTGPATGLAAAGIHACARVDDGAILCWGGNDSGQLGDGTRELRRTPVAWRGVPPAGEVPGPPRLTPPAEGIDVSYHSGHVDWAAARAEGYRFGLTLATAGIDFRDPFLAAHWERIRRAGLVRGAYHFYVSADDPVRQARHFLSHVVLEPGDLRPVVDIESAAQERPQDLAAQLARFVAEVESAIGVKPIIYTGPAFWRDHVSSDAFADHPLWIAEYQVDQPRVPAAWERWQLWQYRGNVDLPHIAPVVDLDRLHAEVDVSTLLVPAGIEHSPAAP